MDIFEFYTSTLFARMAFSKSYFETKYKHDRRQMSILLCYQDKTAPNTHF